MKRFLLPFLITLGHLPAATPQQLEFFESRIRPILAQECYECHSTATKQKGGLLLDSRPGWQAGGDSGPTLIPGNPSASLLLQSIRHEHPDLKMPKNGAKLDPNILADFEQWIANGAPDPRDHPPSKEQLAKEQLHCLSFGQPSVDEFSYNPNYTQDENDTVATLNKTDLQWRGIEITLKIKEDGEMKTKKYSFREKTGEVYDLESYQQALEIPGLQPTLVGRLERQTNGKYTFIPL
jgi:hypothetical protein